MGCDIHTVAERKTADGWEDVRVPGYPGRNYGIWGFMANVRNYSKVPTIAEPRGLPEGHTLSQDQIEDHHDISWLTIEELLAYDYEQMIEDRRYTQKISGAWWNGGATTEPGLGVKQTLREFLGVHFFKWVRDLADAGAERVVFGFCY